MPGSFSRIMSVQMSVIVLYRIDIELLLTELHSWVVAVMSHKKTDQKLSLDRIKLLTSSGRWTSPAHFESGHFRVEPMNPMRVL